MADSLFVPPTFGTLAELVRKFPDWRERVAVQYFNGFRIFRYTYGEFHDLILRCAAFLESLGVRRGDRILLWSPNRPEWAVIYCACAVRGFVMVALDVRHEPDFVERVGQETEAKVLLRTQLKSPPHLGIPTLTVESLFERLRAVEPVRDDAEIRPEDWLEIAYTSGTTGDPKGIVLTHGNIATNVTDIRKIAQAGPADHFLSILPLSHSLEQTGGFWTPMSGGAKVTYLKMLKPSNIFEVFRRDPLTIMIVVPRLLESLKSRMEARFFRAGASWYVPGSMEFAGKLPRFLRKLWFLPVHLRFGLKFRYLVSGGAALTRDVEVFWRSLGFEVLQGYGLTETSPVLTVNRPGRTRIGSVGQPLDHVEVRIGSEQEIQARGPSVFSQFYKKPEATREAFEEGWFRTGDVGEMDADGYLTIRSRKKDVIVTSEGLNIYPEDIEAALARQPGVRESCVLGMGPHQSEIHACLLLEPGISPHVVVRRANDQLPAEQRIEGYSVWPYEEFPKTTTLKIKRNEVRRELESSQAGPEEKPAEEGSRLARLLSEISDVPTGEIRADSRMKQDLGLGSIDIVELVLRIEQEFLVEIDDSAITADSTVADVEELIEHPEQEGAKIVFRRWTRWWPIRALRALFQWLVLRPILWIYCDLEVRGLENLRGVKGPLLVVSNHTSHVDTALILTLLPRRLGGRIAPAALKEYFDTEGRPWHVRGGKWLAWNLTTVLINIFPFPQESGFRKSMVYGGELVDAGWNILIFPEGRRVEEIQLDHFAEGVGVLWENLRVPVVPVATIGGAQVLPRETFFPRRAKVKIAFGKPFLPEGDSYVLITERIRAEVERLWRGLI